MNTKALSPTQLSPSSRPQLTDAVLTRKGINDAYRVMAKRHHPDVGGDPSQFHRLAEAKDRLLLSVAA